MILYLAHNIALSQAVEAQMQCVEMEVGDVMLIHGALDHMSRENTSEFSRRSFQIHLVEGSQDAPWDPLNVCRCVDLSIDVVASMALLRCAASTV